MMLHLVFALAVAQPPDGARVFTDACATCHIGTDPRTPTVAALRQKTVDEILAALTNGKMREQGADLTDAQRRAVAQYLGMASTSGTASAGKCAAAPPFDPSRGPKGTGRGGDLGNTRVHPPHQARPGAEQGPKPTPTGGVGSP